MRALVKFGMAMAAMIKMIATTMSSSIKEKPFFARILKGVFLSIWAIGDVPTGPAQPPFTLDVCSLSAISVFLEGTNISHLQSIAYLCEVVCARDPRAVPPMTQNVTPNNKRERDTAFAMSLRLIPSPRYLPNLKRLLDLRSLATRCK